ncbi:MAG: DUF2240 family protein [Nanoarchaeota archaeon]|nr:DUF2240 family protein [Nanoarchaeota archaeon]
MIEGNYEKLLEKLAKSSGVEKEELERRVEAKRAKLSGLISKEGAAQVIAAELGISFDNEKLKIDELLSGMRKVNVVGKIIDISPVRTFTRNGKEGKVVNFTIADETSNIKVVLWDVNHIELIEKGKIGVESVVEISNASMRDNELHLGSFSEIKPSEEILEKVNLDKVIKEKNIFDFRNGDNSCVRAFIVQAFEPRFFYVCPECKKKANQEGEGFVCNDHGKILPEKRALINLVIDDGTESIRAVLFHESLPLVGITALEDLEKLSYQKEDLIGKEMIFFGNVRINKFFQNTEFIVNEVKELDLDELILKLENK